MEVVIAVVRLNRVNREISLSDFDILLVNEPSSSSNNDIGLHLPRCRTPQNAEHSEIALNCIASLCGFFFTVPINLLNSHAKNLILLAKYDNAVLNTVML